MSTVTASPAAPVPGPSRRGFWTKILASKVLVVSIVVHLLFGTGATYLVVQKMQEKRKLTFAGGPPTNSASKRAIEHKVSMAKKKTTMSAPAQAKRITTTGLAKVSLPDMPSMATATEVIPGKMSGMGGTGVGTGPPGGGMGSGLGGGSGGSIPFFGFRENKGGGALAGNLYDLKQDSGHKPTGMTPDKYNEILKQFVNNGWDEKVFGPYFKAPRPLYTTQIFIPDMSADEGPKAFAMDRGPHKIAPMMWVVHYKGRVTAPVTGKFRFVGFGDDVLEVRFAGQIVLSAGNYAVGNGPRDQNYMYDFMPAEGNRKEFYQGYGSFRGTTIAVQGGAQYDMEVLVGEQPGGFFCSHLLIEQEGVTYAKDKDGNPKLPIFQLMAGKPSKTKSLPPFAAESLVWKGTKSGNGAASLLELLKRQ